MYLVKKIETKNEKIMKRLKQKTYINNSKSVKFFLENLNDLLSGNKTISHYDIGELYESKQFKIIETIVEKKLISNKNYTQSLFGFAIEHNHEKMIDLLIEDFENSINKLDEKERTMILSSFISTVSFERIKRLHSLNKIKLNINTIADKYLGNVICSLIEKIDDVEILKDILTNSNFCKIDEGSLYFEVIIPFYFKDRSECKLKNDKYEMLLTHFPQVIKI